MTRREFLRALTIILGGSLMAGCEPQTPVPAPWSVRMADSVLRRQVPFRWRYEHGLALLAILRVWQRTGEARYLDHVRSAIDPMIGANGGIDTYAVEEYNLDQINPGRVLFPLYGLSGDERYKRALSLLREQLRGQPRTSEAGFWHKKIYPHQMWLDGIYMASPFYAEFAQTFDEPAGFDDVARQLTLIEQHTRDARTGLLYHGWDESRQQRWADPATGCSPSVWGRAMGWYAMALVDVLDYWPLDHAARSTIVAILERLAIAVAAVQDPASGLWYQVLDQGGRAGNYLEASASCMFVYALAKAVRRGYLAGRYAAVAERGYRGVLARLIQVDAQGSVSLTGICGVAGLGGSPYRDGSYEYYVGEPVVTNDYKGVGPFIMASLEMEATQTAGREHLGSASMTGHAAALFNVRDYGALGDGAALDTAALQAAVDACGRAGGGTVYVPAGRYVTGSIVLQSDIALHIDAGATLLGSEDERDYPVIETRWEGAECEAHAPLIGGTGLRNVAITGRGTIDGRGAYWWQRRREQRLRHPRPRLIAFDRCSNVLLEGLTLVNSPSWTVHPLRCENVIVERLTIANPADSPNTDGIDPESCRYVHIANCHIDVGDDCIAIKSGTEAGGRATLAPCEAITIVSCTMVHGHGGVVIGSEMSGSVRNVVIANCVFVGTDRGLRLKSRRGRGGVIEDVRATNIVMQGVLCPFTMNLYYHIGMKGDKDIADRRPHPVTEGTPRVRRIHFGHITARDARYAAAFLDGLPEMPLDDISFSDISISMAAGAPAGLPEMADGIEAMQRAGFLVRQARGLRLHNVQVDGQLGPALSIAAAVDVDIAGSGTPTPAADAPVMQLENVAGALVHGLHARPGTGVFLQVEGKDSRDIALRGNDLANARQAVARADDVAARAVTIG